MTLAQATARSRSQPRSSSAPRAVQVEQRDAYLWIVPVNVAGHWTLRDERGVLEASLDLVQQFQRLGGTMTIRGKTQPLLGAYVTGDNIGFTFTDSDGAVRSIRAQIDGKEFKGNARFAGQLVSVTGKRV